MGRADGRMPTRGIQNPIPTIVQTNEGNPISPGKANPEIDLIYDVDGALVTLKNTVDGIEYQRTLTYTNGLLTNVTPWTQV